MNKRFTHPLVYITLITATVGLAVFVGYTLGYQKRVDLVQTYVNTPSKVILPVAEPTGSKVTSQEI